MKTKTAIEMFGSPLALARALGITRAAIYQWRETVPPLREYQIRELLAARAAVSDESMRAHHTSAERHG